MSSISILSGDWVIEFDDETVGSNAVAGLKMIRPAVATPTITTVNALYSAVADAMDELNAMDDENPMLPVTPTSYTMENGYFIPRRGIEYLTGGAIESTSWTTEIRSIAYTDTVADFADGDIGRQVVGGTTGDTGTLLDFEVLPDGTKVAWIRPDDTATDTFDDASETLTVTGDGGTGDCTSTAISQTGESLYSNIEVIGSVDLGTEVYVVQDRVKLTDYLGAFQWWATDSTVATGIIDILVRVKLNDTVIADGDLEVFGRRYTSLYSNFRLNVGGGGRSALPLASQPDINNTTGYARFTTDAETGGGWSSSDVGTIIRQDGGGNEQNRAILTAVTGTGPNYTIDLYYVGDLTGYVDNDVLEDLGETKTITLSSNQTATPDGPTDAGAGEGATVTVNFGTTTVDHDADGTAEPYSITIDAQNNVPASKVYERIKYLCRRGAGDPFDNTIGQDGEQYRGIELQAQYNTPSGTFGEGEAVDVLATGYTARSVSVNTTDTYVMLTDQQTSLDALVNTNVLRDEALDTVTIENPVSSIAPIAASPFGTFTGTQIFGARGVVYINPNTGEEQNYILTDDNGIARTPPNTVNINVLGLATGDRVLVARDTGTAGVIDKDQLAVSTFAQGSSSLVAGSAIDSETPQAGVLRVVDVGNQDEQRYHYSSYSGSTFTITAVTDATGTATAGSNNTTIIGTGTSWSTGGEPVVPGMLVRNTTEGTVFSEVVSVDSDTQLTVTDNGTSWSSQAWEINEAVRTYASDDNIYIPLIDVIATTTTVSNTLIKQLSSDFGIVTNIRQGKVILPFTQNGTVGDNGVSINAVRSLDTIAT